MTYYSVIMQDNPMAYWRMDEASGTVLHDKSTNGYNGTIANSNVTYAQNGGIRGDIDTSMLFDGSVGKVDITASLSMVNFSHFSVECWANLSTATFAQNARLMANSHTDVDLHGFQLFFDANAAALNFQAGNGGAGPPDAKYTHQFASSVWYHVVGTFNSTTLVLYVNGVSQATASLSGNINTPNSALGLAYADTYNGDFFPGTMDEVTVYNYTLTADQVRNHYNAGIASLIVRPEHRVFARVA